MENKIIKLDTPEMEVIEKSRAKQIKDAFDPMVKMLIGFEEKYNIVVSEANEEITKAVTIKAKRLRLDIGKVRIETGKLKDKQKEYIRLEDKAIMGVHNVLVWAVKEKEDKLKEIENFFEIQEQKRLESLQAERAEKLSAYIDDAHDRNLSGMDDDVWNAYFSAKKKEYEDRIEAERIAEEERIERERLVNLAESRNNSIRNYWQFIPEEHTQFELMPEEEWEAFVVDVKSKKEQYDEAQERIRLENARLQKEAAEKESAAKLEAERMSKRSDELNPYIIFIRDYSKMISLPDEDYNKEFSSIKIAAEEHWESERLERLRKAKESEEKEEKERIERERIEEEQRAEKKKREEAEEALRIRVEAEKKEKEQAEAERQAELAKGDAEKVKDLIEYLNASKTKFTFKSAKNKKMYSDVGELIDKVIVYIQK